MIKLRRRGSAPEEAKKPEINPRTGAVHSQNDSVSGLYQAVSGHIKAVPDAERIRKWYEKMDGNSRPGRYRWERITVFILLLGVAVVAAYHAVDPITLAAAILVLIAYSLAADPLALMWRRWSQTSRLIMASAVIPIFVFLARPGIRAAAVAAAVIVTAAVIAAKGNGHWLAAETYKMSPHVRKALRPDNRTDHRDACAAAWQADGAREVTAAAAEMGAYHCAPIEWAARKAAYVIGYSRADSMTRQAARERAEAVKRAARAEGEAAYLRERISALKDYAADYDRYQAALEERERIAREGARAVSQMMADKEEIRKLQARISALEAANEELIKTADNPVLAAEDAERETQRRLKEAAEKGFSVRQAEAYAACSHRKAQEYLKAYRDQKAAKGETEQKEGATA